jgi:glycosyltransferase involved in cell wall biosynthesis
MMDEQASNTEKAKVRLGIIATAPSPYRIHQHQRVVSELRNVELFSVFLQDYNWQPWQHSLPAEIQPVIFQQSSAKHQVGRFCSLENQLYTSRQICYWLNDKQIDAVILTGYNDLAKLKVVHWCQKHGVPLFIFGDSNIRCDRTSVTRSFAKKLLVKWVIRRASGVMPCGRLGAAYFAQYGATEETTFFVPHEPDYELIQSLDAATRDNVRQRFNLPRSRRRIVYCGRLAAVKRVDLLIEAFQQIAVARPEWDLVVIGDGPLRERLEASVCAHLRDRVRWLGFLDQPADIAGIYRNCDVFVLPSDYEPWAVVVCEAAAAGLALIASDVVGAGAELIENGKNGYSFPAGNSAALKEALLEVTEPVRLAQMQGATPLLLKAWRQRGDPVDGIAKALRSVGLGVYHH